MATKKQKREAAEAKRKAFEEQERRDGLAAQEIDHERRRIEDERTRGEMREINARHQEILEKAYRASNLQRMEN
jgi:hypothetical protein